jgi:hypothetical protein
MNMSAEAKRLCWNLLECLDSLSTLILWLSNRMRAAGSKATEHAPLFGVPCIPFMSSPECAGVRGIAVKVRSNIACLPANTTSAPSKVLLTVVDGLVNCHAEVAGTVTVILPDSQSSVVMILHVETCGSECTSAQAGAQAQEAACLSM